MKSFKDLRYIDEASLSGFKAKAKSLVARLVSGSGAIPNTPEFGVAKIKKQAKEIQRLQARIQYLENQLEQDIAQALWDQQ